MCIYIYIYIAMGLQGLPLRDFGGFAALGFQGHAAVGDLKVLGGWQE